jgi:outer membrane protein insertion porin family
MGRDFVRVMRLGCASVLVIVWLADGEPVSAQFRRRGAEPPTTARPGQATEPRRAVPYYRPQTGAQVRDVLITGNRNVSAEKIRSYLKTRPDRIFDEQLVQADVRSLIATGLFRDVRTYTEPAQDGITVTFEVFERPTIGYVRFVGNERIKNKVLLRESGLKVGDALNTFSVTEGRRRLGEFYRKKGYSDAEITIIEGNKPEHAGIAYGIHEGTLQRIWWTRFEGNTVAPDARLRTQIQSKPGILWMWKGKVDTKAIDEDVDRLTAYYRSLGFFQAKISREPVFDKDRKWLTLTYTIDEGPQYRIRDIRIVGNQKFQTRELTEDLELKSGDPFHLAKLHRDENTLRDIYGSQGYIMASIEAEPRFLEEPGQLDLVYQIKEGEQYRVGRVLVNIDGDQSHTRRSVVLNRLSLRPGDIVDIREVRSSERRLKAAQLFMNEPAQGVVPRIVVKPAERGDQDSSIAQPPSEPAGASTFRGQSPDGWITAEKRPIAPYYPARQNRLADLVVDVQFQPDRAGSAP